MQPSILLTVILVGVAMLVGLRLAARERHVGFAITAFVIVAARLVVAHVNASTGPLPGAEFDAVVFERDGFLLCEQWALGHWSVYGWAQAYSNMIAAVYCVGGRSLVLIGAANSVVVMAALVNIVAIGRYLGLRPRHLLGVFAFVGLFPTLILFTAVPVREAGVLLALTMAIRGTVVTRDTMALRAWLVIGGFTLGVMLHAGLVVLAPLPIVLLMWRRSNRLAIQLPGLLLANAVAGLLALSILVKYAEVPKLERYVTTGRSLDGAELSQMQSLKARGEGAYTLHQYRTGSTVLDYAAMAPEALIRIMFSPLPWDMPDDPGLRTAVKLFDVALHAALLVLAILALRRRAHVETWILFGVYLLLMTEFGLATGNDGVALRHRATFLWLLVLVAVQWLPSRANQQHRYGRRALPRSA